ncbi:hypothetical protein PROFUN_11307 [Planoprotostelium fungivorum]|uniref:Uncharacterized protein n=1 Tax=Planoprotostelium fungivorum TaxID=1890364 RepID=A0A2P6N2J8_9EUKA|nr:hypothetical protein PROFUN_11307 [Planoprotostelium fungivorum]
MRTALKLYIRSDIPSVQHQSLLRRNRIHLVQQQAQNPVQCQLEHETLLKHAPSLNCDMTSPNCADSNGICPGSQK